MERTAQLILAHFHALQFWTPVWERSAVVVVGSTVRGIQDEFTDIDVLVFVPQEEYHTLYESYRRAVEGGTVEVLNPRAFLYDEFPLALIPGINGHYKLHPFEEVEARLAGWEDVTMWIHSHARILHDPSGRYGLLQQRARSYPEEVWREKVRGHFLRAYDAAITASNPLRRGDRQTVVLVMTACVTHLLRLCCLLERRPFPYDKWLLREAMETEAGRELRGVFESFFAEISRPEIRRVEPAAYGRPEHRNADLEAYPLHMVWRHARAYLEPRLPGREPGPGA